MLLSVVVSLSVRVVEVLLQLVLNNLLRNRNLNHLNELSQHLIACLRTLIGDLSLGNLLLNVFLQFINGVELRGQLGELVVSFGKFTLLHGGKLHLNNSLLTGVIPTRKLGLERCVLTSRQAQQGFINTLKHGARTDLV